MEADVRRIDLWLREKGKTSRRALKAISIKRLDEGDELSRSQTAFRRVARAATATARDASGTKTNANDEAAQRALASCEPHSMAALSKHWWLDNC